MFKVRRQESIIQRYTAESGSNSTLSCGGNLPHLDLEPGEAVLDLGCGRGIETLEAARLVAPDGSVTGLDLTQAMIDKASEMARKARVDNTVFVRGDIESLPFSDNSFDAVISNCVLNHAKNKLAAYCEIYRILKPGGRFVISDAVTLKPLPASVRDDPQAWADCFGGAIVRESYLEQIRDAGFPQIKILKEREYIKNGYDFASLTILGYKNA